MENYRRSTRRKRSHLNSIEKGVYLADQWIDKRLNKEVLSCIPKKRIKNIEKWEIDQENSDTEDELVMPSPHTPTHQDKMAKQTGTFYNYYVD